MANLTGSLRIGSKIRGQNFTTFQTARLRTGLRILGEASIAYSIVFPVVAFSATKAGLSISDTQLVASGPLGCKKFTLRTSGNVEIDKLLGVVRWGYCDPSSNLLQSFVEIGWDPFRSNGKFVNVDSLPDGKHLVVFVRWYVANVGWMSTISQ